MVNLLYIIDDLLIGGAQEWLLTVIKAIDRKKFRVIVAALFANGPIGQEIQRENVPVKVLKAGSRYDLKILFKLITLIRKEKIQIVHTHLSIANFYGRLAAYLARTPVIIASLHNIFPLHPPYYIRCDKWLYPLTSQIITVSAAVKDWVVREEGVNPDKFITIHNAVDLSKFDISVDQDKKREELGLERNTPLIGMIGTLDERVDLPAVLKAMPGILKEIPKARLLIIGDGPTRKSSEALTEKLGLNAQVIFCGYRRDIPELISLFNVFVTMPPWEAFGIVLLEAMAMAKPVICTNRGGVLEVVREGETGFLIPPGDIQALTAATIKLLKDKALAGRMGEAGRKLVQREFSSKSLINKLEKVYDWQIRKRFFLGGNCNLCGSNDSKLIYRGKTSNIVKCLRCGLVYNAPMPSKETLKQLYGRTYYCSGYFKYKESRINSCYRLLEKIEEYKPKGKMLDVGCGVGFFINAAKNKNWQVCGIEPSSYASNYAKKELNLNISNDELKKVNFELESFDLITFLDTLGHIADPLSDLKRANQLLKKDGLLVVRVPKRTESVFKAARLISLFTPKIEGFLHLPYQLYHFTGPVVKRLLIKADFQTIKIQNSKAGKRPIEFNPGLFQIFRQLIIKILNLMFARGDILIFARKF